MLKALIISIAILGTWLAVGPTRTPAAAVGAAGFASTTSPAPEPGTRGPVIQL